MKSRVAAVVFAVLAGGCVDEVDAPELSQIPAADEEGQINRLTIDFGEDGENSWYAVNDTVMGGVSSGTVVYTPQTFVFEGAVSTASNGGFTSVRSPAESWDLSEYSTLVVRMRNSGQPFTMVLADSPNWWQGQFRYDIDSTGGEWMEVVIPLEDFEFHDFSTGYPEPTGEMMKPRARKDILNFEFMSKLFEDGDFALEVDYLVLE